MMEHDVPPCMLCGQEAAVPQNMIRSGEMSYCEPCKEVLQVLASPHTLYVRAPSRQKLEAISCRLLTVSHPSAGVFDPWEDGLWSLTFWYQRVEQDLLGLLATLPERYSLERGQAKKDSLAFWPGETAPTGVLSSLLQRLLETHLPQWEDTFM